MAVDNGRPVSFGWLAGVLLAALVAVTPSAIRGFVGPVASAEAATGTETNRRIRALELSRSEQGFAIRDIKAAQEREHRLLVRIARKMGIEVAE